MGHILNGASLVFELASLGSTFALTYLSSAAMLKSIPVYDDYYSVWFCHQKTFVAWLCGIIAFLTAAPIMQVFDTISDNALFVYALQKMRDPENSDIDDTVWGQFVDIVGDGFELFGCIQPRKK